MSAMEITGAAVADQSSAAAVLARFKRETQQRYVDAAVGPGLAALDDAGRGLGPTEPVRTGLLLATETGPADTRGQYLDSYAGRGRKSVSATLFSNCGYNIVGAMLARSRGIRGPVLTFGAGRDWGVRLLATAGRMFASGRVDRVFLGRAEADGAAMLALDAARSAARNPTILTEAQRVLVLWPGQAAPRPIDETGERLLWTLAERWLDRRRDA